MTEMNAGVLVIGGGPGGYVCAIRAGQLGLDTVLVEEGRVGGTCLNIGCIPSKALITAAAAFHRAQRQAREAPMGIHVTTPELDFAATQVWKDGIVGRLASGVSALLKKAGVKTVRGHATLLDGKTCAVATDTGRLTIRAEHVVLATGSAPAEIAALPFGGRIVSSAEALALPAVPARLAVVGAGYIGLELGMAYAKLGATVSVIEAEDRILPAWDADLTRPVAYRLAALGVEVMTGAVAHGPADDGLMVAFAGGATREIAADVILVAIGRQPRTAGFGLERLDLTMNGGCVAIDDRCATSMRNVWAVGDLTGEPMLAHRAMAQGEMVAEIIAEYSPAGSTSGRSRRFASPTPRSSASASPPRRRGRRARDHRRPVPLRRQRPRHDLRRR